MNVSHLGLPVRELKRSLAFYTRYFDFDPATVRSYPDGTVIVRNEHQFDLALHPTSEVPEVPAFLHFGFAMTDVGAVHALRMRLEADGVQIVARDDEPELTSFKCLDPDGWRVEVYCQG